jgi:hypothetical protein
VSLYGNPMSYRVEIADSRADTGFGPIEGLPGRMNSLANEIQVAILTSDGVPLRPLPEYLLFDPCGERFSGVIQLTNRKGKTVAVEVLGDAGQVNMPS